MAIDALDSASYLCFLNRVLRRIVRYRRRHFLFRRRYLYADSSHPVSSTVAGFILCFLLDSGGYDVLSMSRAVARLRRLLRRLKMRSFKKMGIGINNRSRIKKYLLRQRLRNFIMCQHRQRLSSRFGGRSNVVREKCIVQCIDYRRFIADKNFEVSDVGSSCSRRARTVCPSDVPGSNLCPQQCSPFPSYFTEESDDFVTPVEAGVTSHIRSQPYSSLLDGHDLCDFGPPDCACNYCGALMWYEERNNKRTGRGNAKFSICCQEGKVQIPFSQQPPSFLNYLFTSSDSRAVQFRKDIRPYNSIFVFTSIGAHIDTNVNDGRGPYAFVLCGQNYHRIGTLLPVVGVRPKFCQIYFYDSENELSNRLGALGNEPLESNLDPYIVSQLMSMINEHNVLAKVFRTARERFNENQMIPLRIRLIGTRQRDARRYNLPTVAEVAALIVGDELDLRHERDIVVHDRNMGLQRILDTHPSFMALQYPLLFPYGEDGYMPTILARDMHGDIYDENKTISNRTYIAFRLHFRLDEAHTLLLAGRLQQQYIVDAFTCIEGQRLRWYRDHQSVVRADLYQRLMDSVVAGDTRASSIGRRVVLPSSFTGGPRYMVQNYQDAIAICRWAGPPDLFITFTCNPKWNEIRKMADMLPGIRPDGLCWIIARVFHMKLHYLMTVLVDQERFGKVIGAINVVEFQKRGLPHAHILLFLHPADKLRTAFEVDRVISAELPPKEENALFHDPVLEIMIHGPCSSACLVDGKCSKHFPKDSCEYTVIDEDGNVRYRRRSQSVRVVKNGVVIDNGWVVPYNPSLLKEFRAHINVERVTPGRLVKYLFKYLNKGSDRSLAAVRENCHVRDSLEEFTVDNVDEIDMFWDCRHVSAPEACWRIYGFDLHYHVPAVEQLSFHLENEQDVLFHDNDDLFDVVNNPTVRQTKFTEWMKMNDMYESARQLTYVEFPNHWVWYPNERIWKPRERGFKLGRLYYAHPTSGERFYMRMLLGVQKGCMHFRDIKTVNGVEYGDHKTACQALGLLENDNEWNTALLEASSWANAASLRFLFVTFLLCCEITDPSRMWSDHWRLFSDDIERREGSRMNSDTFTLPEDILHNLVLEEIEVMLNKNNRSLHEFRSMPYPDIFGRDRVSNRMLFEEFTYDRVELRHQFQRMHSKLNSEQAIVFSSVIDAVIFNTGGLFFGYGSGGTGKTYLWNTIIAYLRSEGKIVLPVASSGLAALLFPGGRTAHSRFKIPTVTDAYSCCTIGKKTDLAELIQKADLIVWDEAPMTHRYDFEAVDRTFRDLMSGFGAENVNKGLWR